MDSGPNTLRKEERLGSRTAIEALFSGGNPSLSSFPLRAVFMPTSEKGVHIMVSVSKRFFKRAVKRNRIKRQIREAYRQNKSLLTLRDEGLNIAFLWSANEMLPTSVVFHKVKNLLSRINESVSPSSPSL